MIYNGLYILAILCLMVVLSEWLVRKTFLRHFGTALAVILFTAIMANIGLLPTSPTAENPVPVYDGIFHYVAPISIFWILLRVNLRNILKAGGTMIGLFLISALGTLAGVLLGMWAINGPETIGDSFNALGGMFVGTYTGGSVNFNALALEYNIVKEGNLYTTSVVVDNILTALWMILTIALPKLLAPFWTNTTDPGLTKSEEPLLGIEEDTEAIHPIDLGIVLALGLVALWASIELSALLSTDNFKVPMIIIITIFALIVAQLPIASKLKGAQVLGMFSVYLFLAVIGAYCDLDALAKSGKLGVILLAFTTITILVHGCVTFGVARLMKVDLDMAAVVSQANVGGGTSALALARSLGRNDLVLPAVLLGSLGNAIGTFLGFWASGQLLPWLL